MQQLSLEIEKERYALTELTINHFVFFFSWHYYFWFFHLRVDYLEKSKHLQDQLRDLRSEIEVLKVGEKQSEFDIIHDEQVRTGENKYSTLKRVNQLLPVLFFRTQELHCDRYKSNVCFIFNMMQWKLTFIYPVGTLLFNKIRLENSISASNILFISSLAKRYS